MNPVLRASEVHQNEEHAGRYPLAAHVLLAGTVAGFKTAKYWMKRTSCKICGRPNHNMRGFGDETTADNAFYAVCGNCGNWNRL